MRIPASRTYSLIDLPRRMQSVREHSSLTHLTAVGRQLLADLRSSMEEIQADKSIRVVILRSEVPGAFCAGADLKVHLCSTTGILIAGLGKSNDVAVGGYYICEYASDHLLLLLGALECEPCGRRSHAT